MGALLRRWAAGALSIIVFAGSAFGITRTVTSTADSGPGSLRDTIAASGSGDIINFAVTGTIMLTSASLSVNHNLTIQGPGSGSLTITRQFGSADFRIFYFDNGTWTLSDVTIRDGNDSIVGGGIYNGNGNLTLNNCVVTNNIGSQRGGGIGNNATMTMNNVFVLHNNSAIGGGLYNAGTLTIHNSTFSYNFSASDGGALNNTGTLTIDTSTFDNNTGAGGGAIFTGDGTISNSTFFNNHGTGNALRLKAGTTTVKSCTFSSNVSEVGGSIYFISSASALQIGNTILDSRGSANGTFYTSNGATITSLGYNLATDGGAGVLTATGDQLNTDPKLDPYGLQYNGGYTDTIALVGGSPAIDKGKSFSLTTDERGVARTYDYAAIGNASGGDGTDIGAFEASGDPLANGLVVNTTADHNDGVCGAGDCTLREAIARAQSLFGLHSPPLIVFGPGVSGTINLSSVLDLTSDVLIDGPGARILALSGAGAHRVFNGDSGHITIQGLTIRDGNYISGQNHGETQQGGAVFNVAYLTFNNCAFVNNTVMGATNVINGGVGGTGQGGAIYNRQTLDLNGCTFSGNSAVGAVGAAYSSGTTLGPGGNGGAGQGGAVFNDLYGGVTIQNCTFHGNTATGGNGGTGFGTIYFSSGGNANGAAVCNLWALLMDSCTVSGNIGSGGAGAGSQFRHGAHGSGNGGVSALGNGVTAIGNSIVAGNTGSTAPDAEGTFESEGFNLIGIGDQSTGFSTSEQVGTTASPLNPHLAAFGNYGGPTDTMLLLYGSTALDAGYSSLILDQRGVSRPIDTLFANPVGGNAADIGAVEMNLNGGGPDTDGDGMSDDFEIFYGFNPLNIADGAQDSDGDGLTNAQESAFGTNPLDPASAFRITTVVYANPFFTVEFGPTVPQKSYRLERKDSLAPGSTWSSIPGLPDSYYSYITTGRFDDENATAPHYYYRVRLLP